MVLRNSFRAAVLAFPFVILAGLPSQAHDYDWPGHDDVFLQYEFGEYRYPEAAWAAGGVSCKGGWKIVHTRGFRDVRPIDCHGRTFTYVGWWRGDTFKVLVNSGTGRIIGVTPA
jgi:hypothetical protein